MPANFKIREKIEGILREKYTSLDNEVNEEKAKSRKRQVVRALMELGIHEKVNRFLSISEEIEQLEDEILQAIGSSYCHNLPACLEDGTVDGDKIDKLIEHDTDPCYEAEKVNLTELFRTLREQLWTQDTLPDIDKLLAKMKR